MADLSLQKVSRTGLNPSFDAAAAGGDRIPFTRGAYLHVKNGSAGAITVTINSVRACDQGFDHDESVSVPAGGERLIGPFNSRFRSSDGYVAFSYSGVTSLTVAGVEVPS